VVGNSDLYSGGPKFKSSPEMWLSLLRYFFVFLASSKGRCVCQKSACCKAGGILDEEWSMMLPYI
jgi:hypothetical protein